MIRKIRLLILEILIYGIMSACFGLVFAAVVLGYYVDIEPENLSWWMQLLIVWLPGGLLAVLCAEALKGIWRGRE